MLPKICIVCFANYCRSPVAETILTKLFEGKYEVVSAGIRPLKSSDMDERSRKFLIKKNYKPLTHIPRKFSRELAEGSKIILALDAYVLMELNRKHRNKMQKIKLLSFQTNKIKLPDPYKLDEESYNQVMEDIELVCKSLKI